MWRRFSTEATSVFLLMIFLSALPHDLVGDIEESRPDLSFHLINWNGEEVSLDSLKGTASIIVYTYAKCDYACPMVTFYLRTLDSDLGMPRDLRFVFISVNPAEDAPTEVRKFFKRFGLDPEEDRRWFFLNGPRAEIDSVLEKNRIEVKRTELSDGTLVEHTILVQVLSRAGELVESFDTYLWDNERMQDAVQTALRGE